MDAIQLMLAHLAGHAAPDAAATWRPDDQGIYTILVGDETQVHLHEDHATGRIHMFASPGAFPPVAEASEAGPPLWQLPADNGGDGDFTNEVRIDARSGTALLIQSAPRERLDATSYQHHLDSFMRWLGIWQRNLESSCTQ